MHYALSNTYPIDTVEQVKTASAYFSKYVTQFHPAQRQAFATNLEKRAHELGVVLDNADVHNYNNTRASYSPDFDLHMTMRKTAATGIKVKVAGKDVDAGQVLGKIACMKEILKPSEMVDLLYDFDKKAGLAPKYDRNMRDPFFTVYGSVSDPRYDHNKIASDTYASQLEHACHNNGSFMSKIADAFGKDFAEGFKADPVNVYASMPTPEKDLIIGHLKDSADEV